VVDFETSGVKVIISGDGCVRKSGLGVETMVPAGSTVNSSPVECDEPLGLTPVTMNG